MSSIINRDVNFVSICGYASNLISNKTNKGLCACSFLLRVNSQTSNSFVIRVNGYGDELCEFLSRVLRDGDYVSVVGSLMTRVTSTGKEIVEIKLLSRVDVIIKVSDIDMLVREDEE